MRQIELTGGKAINLGSFPGTQGGKIAAARCYNKAALKLFGKYAKINTGV